MVARELVEKKLQNSCELIPFEEADDLEQKQKLAEADADDLEQKQKLAEADDLEQKQKLAEADADDLEQKQELAGADADVDGTLEDSRTPN